MSDETSGHKVKPQHLARAAVVYVRQSSEKQVRQNKESQRLQYALQDRARDLGWKQIEVIDIDLGRSASLGAARREGFDRLVGAVARGEVGIVLSREVSRLIRVLPAGVRRCRVRTGSVRRQPGALAADPDREAAGAT